MAALMLLPLTLARKQTGIDVRLGFELALCQAQAHRLTPVGVNPASE